MARKNTPITRIDPDFQRDMKLVALERLNRGLARLNPRDLSMAEMTKLMRRTDAYPNLLAELRTKPKRKQQ